MFQLTNSYMPRGLEPSPDRPRNVFFRRNSVIVRNDDNLSYMSQVAYIRKYYLAGGIEATTIEVDTAVDNSATIPRSKQV
ncbi:hypothetical protein N7508_005913 [Penicillium antarcticum]|uniref:uncharacterized protein n=1 Tax=Penicillium antarcticum TaxID=416450 RepID=UPI00239689FB|nr:uncharacterized protein N7508_005913 [Penicillium antarcticum]KAJ5306898.1 hypothetical protein N7508_005913 [Penicillium antarcticum]